MVPLTQMAELRAKAENALVKKVFRKPNPPAAAIFYSQAADAYAAQGDYANAFDCCQRGLQIQEADPKIRLFLFRDGARYA